MNEFHLKINEKNIKINKEMVQIILDSSMNHRVMRNQV